MCMGKTLPSLRPTSPTCGPGRAPAPPHTIVYSYIHTYIYIVLHMPIDVPAMTTGCSNAYM